MPLGNFTHRPTGFDSGVYTADDDTRRYSIRRVGRKWYLTVRELAFTSRVAHTIGQPIVDEGDHATLRMCSAVIHEYSALGDDYKPDEHDGRERMAEAVRRAHESIKSSGPVQPTSRKL